MEEKIKEILELLESNDCLHSEFDRSDWPLFYGDITNIIEKD